MRHNIRMIPNLRIFFSLLWIASTGCLLASVLAFVFTWGSYFDYLLWSAAFWGIATLGTIATSLE